MPDITQPVEAPPTNDIKTQQQGANTLEEVAQPAVDAVEAQEDVSTVEDVSPGDPDDLSDLDLSGDEVPEEGISYESEDEELLFGPTMRPEDSMGLVGRTARPLPPRNIERYLPALIAAAREPDAPPELFSFIRLINYHLGLSD